MQSSARNALKETVKKIEPGAVNTEVTLEFAPGVEVVAIITKSSAEKLGLTEGKDVYAVIKSTDVMVAVDQPYQVLSLEKFEKLGERGEMGKLGE